MFCLLLDGDADITENSYDDIATVTSVLKLFFRQLPVPLITFEVYPKLTASGSSFCCYFMLYYTFITNSPTVTW